MRSTSGFGRRAIGAATVAALAVLAAGPALGDGGVAVWVDPNATRPVAEAFREVGLFGPDLLPRTPLEGTTFVPCPARGRCEAGPYAVTSSLSFGFLPAYTGSVTLGVKGPGGERSMFTCTMPGVCPVLATSGAALGSVKIIGNAAPGSAGEYVIWVVYE